MKKKFCGVSMDAGGFIDQKAKKSNRTPYKIIQAEDIVRIQKTSLIRLIYKSISENLQ